MILVYFLLRKYTNTVSIVPKWCLNLIKWAFVVKGHLVLKASPPAFWRLLVSYYLPSPYRHSIPYPLKTPYRLELGKVRDKINQIQIQIQLRYTSHIQTDNPSGLRQLKLATRRKSLLSVGHILILKLNLLSATKAHFRQNRSYWIISNVPKVAELPEYTSQTSSKVTILASYQPELQYLTKSHNLEGESEQPINTTGSREIVGHQQYLPIPERIHLIQTIQRLEI